MTLLKAILLIVASVYELLIGAWGICGAVKSFKERRYFSFGIDCMVALASSVYLIKFILL